MLLSLVRFNSAVTLVEKSLYDLHLIINRMHCIAHIFVNSCADTGRGLGRITPSQGMVTDFKWKTEEEAFILTLYDAKYNSVIFTLHVLFCHTLFSICHPCKIHTHNINFPI